MEFQISAILVALVDIKPARVKLICDSRFNSRRSEAKRGCRVHLNVGFNLELIFSSHAKATRLDIYIYVCHIK